MPLPRNVLLIDDDEITNFIDSDVIESLHVSEHISVALGGEEGLDYLERSYNKHADGSTSGKFIAPEIIFLDMNMPEMGGCEFLEKFNERFKTLAHPNPMIFMLSTSFIKEDVDRAFEITPFVKDYFEKPLNRETVKSIIDKYFTNEA